VGGVERPAGSDTLTIGETGPDVNRNRWPRRGRAPYL